MEKNFKEVITEIKEGEVWESSSCQISQLKRGIEIKFKEDEYYNKYYITDETLYTLKRYLYTFAEAFAEYERGIEIESLTTGNKYQIMHGGSDCVEGYKVNGMGFNEIRGKWYINK